MTTTPDAVEAFEKAMNLAFEYHYDPPYNAPISECVKVAMEMLGDSGFTITLAEPAMSEAELEAAMEAAIYECEPERNKVEAAMAIAKKYRGQS